MENVTYRIDDYWPVEGDFADKFFEAERRAIQGPARGLAAVC